MERVEELIKTYAAIDAEAEDILTDRQEVKALFQWSSSYIRVRLQIVELNDKRNKTREALRQLKQITSSKQSTVRISVLQ